MRLVVFHGCVLLVSVACKLWGRLIAGFVMKQAENTRANISLLAIRAVSFRGLHGITLRLPSRKEHFLSREAVEVSSSVATRDLVFRCRVLASVGRESREQRGAAESFGYLWSSY